MHDSASFETSFKMKKKKSKKKKSKNKKKSEKKKKRRRKRKKGYVRGVNKSIRPGSSFHVLYNILFVASPRRSLSVVAHHAPPCYLRSPSPSPHLLAAMACFWGWQQLFSFPSDNIASGLGRSCRAELRSTSPWLSFLRRFLLLIYGIPYRRNYFLAPTIAVSESSSCRWRRKVRRRFRRPCFPWFLCAAHHETRS